MRVPGGTLWLFGRALSATTVQDTGARRTLRLFPLAGRWTFLLPLATIRRQRGGAAGLRKLTLDHLAGSQRMPSSLLRVRRSAEDKRREAPLPGTLAVESLCVLPSTISERSEATGWAGGYPCPSSCTALDLPLIGLAPEGRALAGATSWRWARLVTAPTASGWPRGAADSKTPKTELRVSIGLAATG